MFLLLCSQHQSFEMFGSYAIRHMWRVANVLDNAALEYDSAIATKKCPDITV
jgi:hypothetical protein